MSFYRTESGARFAQLVRMLRERGIKPAEIARRMKLSKPTISNYLAGKINVPESRLDALERIYKDVENPAVAKYPPSPGETVLGMDDAELTEALSGVRLIKERDSTDFEIVRNVIVTYAKKGKASSAVDAAAKKRAAQHKAEILSTKHQAGSKSARHRGKSAAPSQAVERGITPSTLPSNPSAK